ncbi:Serine phosphatase RsbU, regulator of sigma subunit [Streptomyces sp. DvalAA-14]|uniref:SpoIIE family protein phosphatase n=1 Tax=unclassified Streptomyces TaxID=2593676 RepID=UPI00081B0435|nr:MULTISPECIES: SpoIIE family protein phosphatase [unclassified Streptomyces]MYS19369.1 SpoIIE family protein phosphatase [Streptomyces sp. SID4948]SCD42990.1 Serine phosphatase RsbU, regulator of sigma subunit [Streptomyces sp. DvalAA-14]
MTAGSPAADDSAGGFEKTLFDQAHAGIEVYDTDLRVLRANPAILRMRAMPAERVVGAELTDLDASIPISPVIRKAVDSGATVFDHAVAAYTQADPEHLHHYEVTAYPLHDASGRSNGAAAVIHDVTEGERRQGDLDLLSRARDRIGRTLDPLVTAQELADVSVPGFADAVAVDLLESVLAGEAPVGPVTSRLPMRRAAFKGREGQYGAYPVGSASSYVSPTPWTQALADLRPRLVGSVLTSGGWLHHDRVRQEFIARSGVHSIIVTPLTVHGLVIGLASYYRDASRPDPFDDEDLSLAEELAARSALFMDNARRFTREHTVATELQRSLLPRNPPQTAAAVTSQCYLPGRYGAHWFDVLPLSSSRVGLVIGYVHGEDLQASVAMGRLRTATSTLASMDLPPNELLMHLDDVAQKLAREQDEDPATLHRSRPPFTATCLYLTYDPLSHRCAVAAAGHDGPLITSPEGSVGEIEVPRGLPLGQGAPYEQLSTELRVGSLLTFYSDSVASRYPAEAGNRLSRLRDVVADQSADPQEICDRATYRVLRDTPQDGAVLLVARIRELDPDRVASWTFPCEALSVREARRSARDRLARWGLEDNIPATDLIVSELATNVVRHAGGPIHLQLIFDRTLTVEVSDDASSAPHLQHARLQDESGRGLFLVASVAREWGTRYGEAGKTIWAEQDLA